MSIHVSTIIIGASCYGCGIAARKPDSLILEPTVQPGAEFTMTGCPAQNLDSEPETPAARAFRDELKQRKVIENGFLHNAALAPVLAKWCLERKLRIRLNAPVVRRTGSTVSVMEVCGPQSYSADEIIDARPVPGTEKFLYSFLSGGETGVFGEFEVLPSVSPDYLLLRQKLPLPADYREAREQLAGFWWNRPEKLRSAVLLWSSTRFSFDTVDNPVSALDRGLKRGAQ
ncbi:MAG: hypothetical protein V8T90_02210 [Victivallales bacterium]